MRRDRVLFDLLAGPASVPQVRALADRLFESIAPDLATDPYWDAYKLLPRITRFHRFMVRPMSTAKWALAARAEVHGYGRRVRFLLDALETPGLLANAWRTRGGDTQVQLIADGHAAQRLQQVSVTGPCGGPVVWRADVDRDGRSGAVDRIAGSGAMRADIDIDAFADLLPGVRLEARADSQPKRGTVRVVPEARTYSYLVTTPCVPTQLALVLDDRITGRQTHLSLPVGDTPVRAAEAGELPDPGSTPRFVAGQHSPHIWDYRSPPASESIVLGPGLVQVTATEVYAEHQAVTVVADTRIEMAPGVSLIFHGPVTVSGTESQPVVIVAADSLQPFGGVALQGPGTAGSRLQHLHVQGGTRVGDRSKGAGNGGVIYPSLLNVFDTSDITITNARFSHITDAEDVVHTAYVTGLQLSEIDAEQAPTDGVDLEFTEGEVRGLRVLGAGDDCLDLMGVQLRVTDSVLLGCTNNAISAGEESEVSAHGLLIGMSETGVFAKSGSHARLSRSLIYRSGTALEVRGPDMLYQGTNSIGASDLFAVECERMIKRGADTRLEVERIQQALPGPGGLSHLQRNVLGLASWNDLSGYVAGLAQESW